jgi:hypothetical protein
MTILHRSRAAFCCAALLLSALVVPVALAVGVSPASAGIPPAVVITTTADVVDAGDGLLSLREAITATNTDLLAFDTTFQLAGGATYQLTRCNGGTDEDANVGGDLDLLGFEDTVITTDGGIAAIMQTCPGERVLDQRSAADRLSLSKVSVSGGSPVTAGGGVRTLGQLSIDTGTRLHHNRAGSGGGAAVGTDLLMSGSALHDNVTTGDGGGALVSGTATITFSAIYGNRSGANGGGVRVLGPAVLATSTVTQNEAFNGGGFAGSGGTALDTATVVANRAFTGANLLVNGNAAITSSIVALGSLGPDCAITAVVGSGQNVGGDESCDLPAPTDLLGVHPMLAPLAVPSYALQSMASRAPNALSPAVNHDESPCSGAASDQHSQPRGGSACNAGAVEAPGITCAQDFPDVGVAHPFFLDVCWLAQMGVTGGFLDGTFKPGQAVSRQAMSAFIYRLAGAPAFTPPATPTFGDVGTSHPFFREIEWMADTGITVSDQPAFRPGASVSRQAMAAFIYRVAGEPPTVPLGQAFADVSPNHPFYVAIAWLSDNGVAQGFTDGTFRPSASVSRQAMAAFMLRVAENSLIGGL